MEEGGVEVLLVVVGVFVFRCRLIWGKVVVGETSSSLIGLGSLRRRHQSSPSVNAGKELVEKEEIVAAVAAALAEPAVEEDTTVEVSFVILRPWLMAFRFIFTVKCP